MLVMNTISSPS